LGESKTEYSGTLQDLYNNDFRKFIEYNIQDTELLNKLDNKLKFIDLANVIAHTGTVLIPATMGAVALSEQAIINEAHLLGVRLPERKRNDTDDEYQTVHEAIYRKKAAGAYVAYPKIGLHDDIGALDVKSLYPSKIRAMNMSTETIIGQVRQTYTDNYILGKMNNGVKFPEAWEGIFGALEYEMIMAKTDDIVIIDWENGKSEKMTAMDAYQLIFESGHNIVLSANGTIFTLDKQGIIPGLLSKWYSQRIEYQANLEKINLLETGIEVPSDMLEKLTGLL
jgi:DNA polymerase elongation subunit (family B)